MNLKKGVQKPLNTIKRSKQTPIRSYQAPRFAHGKEMALTKVGGQNISAGVSFIPYDAKMSFTPRHYE